VVLPQVVGDVGVGDKISLVNQINQLNLIGGKMKNIECPLCNEKIYAGLGEGCKMCGMALEKDEKFCSLKCEEKFAEIHEIN